MNKKEALELSNDIAIKLFTLKRAIRCENRHMYDRWKAGGFLVDDEIISMYPSLNAVIESVFDEDDEEEEEDND